MRIYTNKIKNRIAFKIKTGYYLELLTPKTMALLRCPENVPHLKITEKVLVHCNFVNNYYQHNSRDLHTFIPNKLFGQLLDISLKKVIFLKVFHSGF